MAKRPLKLVVRIPEYSHPRNSWREAIYAAVRERQRSSKVRYRPEDKLEVLIRLYLSGRRLELHDVDNRLKDCLDALQGRAGGSKKDRRLDPIIPNDRQVFRVVIEKRLPPKQSRGLGHMIVRRLSRIQVKKRSGPAKPRGRPTQKKARRDSDRV